MTPIRRIFDFFKRKPEPKQVKFQMQAPEFKAEPKFKHAKRTRYHGYSGTWSPMRPISQK